MINLLRDKDFIRLKDSFYQVIGYVHPENFVFAFPRYVKVNYATPWRNGSYYSRILEDYSSLTIGESLKNYASEYLVFDFYYDSLMPRIPLQNVDEIYYTHNWPRYLKRNILAKRFEEVLDLISSNANISKEDIGLTGSLLIGIANVVFSDIDIVVYGQRSVEKIKEYILSGQSPFSIVKPEIIRGLDETSFKILSKRKWNKFEFKNRLFSLNPVLKHDEIKIKYGDFKIKNVKKGKIKLKIKEKINPYFYPLTYSVKLLDFEEYPIEELTIFEMYYLDLFEIGNELEVVGMIQFVEERDREYYRIAYGLREMKEQRIRFLL